MSALGLPGSLGVAEIAAVRRFTYEQMNQNFDIFGPAAFYRRWRLRRAARDYHDRLGPWLERKHGAQSTLTAAQIEEAVAELELNSDYMVFGYAAFLDEQTFASLVPRMRHVLPFYEPRTLLLLHGKYRGSIARRSDRVDPRTDSATRR
jgi:hypothetical protein